jgi:hypothetical protein
MKTSNCNCHGTSAASVIVADVCEGALELPRYFPRQLLTPAEMTLEQQYFRTRLRRHNLFMHGWGVACGAEVLRVLEGGKPLPWKVKIKQGYILGPQGDEILIDREQIVDLRTKGTVSVSDDPDDVWCTPVLVDCDDQVPGTLFVAVRYKQIPARPVRVQPADCGCDDTQCELSRLQDGFAIGFLTECPEHQDPPDLPPPFPDGIPDCPTCPESPWVVLAQVDVDIDGTIHSIDNCGCRRIVLSAGNLWRHCTEPPITVDITGGDQVEQGAKGIDVIVHGDGLSTALLSDFGRGITVNPGVINAPDISFKIDVAADAPLGERTFTLWDITGRVFARKEEALTVIVKKAPVKLLAGPVTPALAAKPSPKGKGRK